MGEYRVIAKATSYTMIPKEVEKLSFTVSNDKYSMDVYPKSIFKEDQIGETFSNELQLDILIKCVDFDDAIGIAVHNSQIILDQFAFMSGMPIYSPKIIKIYDVSKGLSIRRITQFFYDKIERVGSKNIDSTLLKPIINGIESLENKKKQRINRAVHWLNRAMNESDSLDRLTYVWSGLESLNPLFYEIYNLKEKSKCPECDYIREFSGTASIKQFFADVMERPEVYSKTRRARNELLHGYEDLNKIRLRVADFEEELLFSLDFAIQFLLKIEKEPAAVPNTSNAEEVIILGHLNVGDFPLEGFEPNIELDVELEIVKDEILIRPIFNINCAKYGLNVRTRVFSRADAVN